MKKKERNTLVEFQIKAIELLDTKFKTPKVALPKDVTYQFEINLEHRFNISEKLVMVVCAINVKHEDELAMLKSSCVFILPQLNDYINTDSQEIKLPSEFVTTINSISISTSRGMLFSFLKGTYLHNAIIPIIDPTAFNVK